MSIQNFSDNHVPAGLNRGTDNAVRTFTVFLLLSIGIHVAMVLSFLAFSPIYEKLSDRLYPKEPELMTVDVVELPPATGGPQKAPRPPKTPTRYAERTNVVEKETFPEGKQTGRYLPGIIIPPVHKAEGSPAHKGANEGAKGSGPQKASLADTKGEGASKGSAQTDGETVGIGKGAQPLQGVQPHQGAAAKAGSGSGDGALSGPGLFLPGETISALERKYEAESPKGEQGKTLNLNTSELRYANYLVNMKRRIELYWDYPEVASRNGWRGRLFIDFTIKKDGTLGDVILVKSSGYPVLDDAAITAIKLAMPFSSFPENFGIEQINIKGQFEYDISYSPPR